MDNEREKRHPEGRGKTSPGSLEEQIARVFDFRQQESIAVTKRGDVRNQNFVTAATINTGSRFGSLGLTYDSYRAVVQAPSLDAFTVLQLKVIKDIFKERGWQLVQGTSTKLVFEHTTRSKVPDRMKEEEKKEKREPVTIPEMKEYIGMIEKKFLSTVTWIPHDKDIRRLPNGELLFWCRLGVRTAVVAGKDMRFFGNFEHIEKLVYENGTFGFLAQVDSEKNVLYWDTKFVTIQDRQRNDQGSLYEWLPLDGDVNELAAIAVVRDPRKSGWRRFLWRNGKFLDKITVYGEEEVCDLVNKEEVRFLHGKLNGYLRGWDINYGVIVCNDEPLTTLGSGEQDEVINWGTTSGRYPVSFANDELNCVAVTADEKIAIIAGDRVSRCIDGKDILRSKLSIPDHRRVSGTFVLQGETSPVEVLENKRLSDVEIDGQKLPKDDVQLEVLYRWGYQVKQDGLSLIVKISDSKGHRFGVYRNGKITSKFSIDGVEKQIQVVHKRDFTNAICMGVEFDDASFALFLDNQIITTIEVDGQGFRPIIGFGNGMKLEDGSACGNIFVRDANGVKKVMLLAHNKPVEFIDTLEGRKKIKSWNFPSLDFSGGLAGIFEVEELGRIFYMNGLIYPLPRNSMTQSDTVRKVTSAHFWLVSSNMVFISPEGTQEIFKDAKGKEYTVSNIGNDTTVIENKPTATFWGACGGKKGKGRILLGEVIEFSYS